MIFLPFFIFILGLLIGSFLNVVILRMNTGRSIVTERSTCARCSRVLAWYELIPVFSFLALRGKCRTCRNPISFQYAIVELVTGVMFVALYSSVVVAQGFAAGAWIVYFFTLVVTALCIIIFVYDIRHKIIPDSIVFPLILLSVVAVIWRSFVLGQGTFLTLIAQGVMVALPFFLLWYFSRGRAMGFGDVKLALAIGWLLGLSGGALALIFSFWIGSVVSLLLMAISRGLHLKSEIPFAPFLIAGLALVAIFHLSLNTFFPL